MKRLCDFLEKEEKAFRVCYFGRDGETYTFPFTLQDEYKGDGDDYEWKYAFIDFEYLPEIDKLKVGETMFVRLSRDEENEKGIVIRTL